MKKITLVLFLFVLSATVLNAKVWRVNNNPSLDADVLQASTLFDNTNNASNPEAAANDTIYFEPSTSTYSGFSVDMPNIVIMGYGYFLSLNPNMQAMANTPSVSYISFHNGSAGSKVTGLEINTAIYIYTSNITVSRCLAGSIEMYHDATSTTYNNIAINKCYLQGITSPGIHASVTSVSISIENCIFSSKNDLSNCNGISLNNKVRGLIRNNTFNYANNIYCYNFYIANNIIVHNTNFGDVNNSGNNVFRNNVFSHPINNTSYNMVNGNNGANSGNQFTTDMSLVFKGATNNTFNGGGTFNNFITSVGGFTLESKFELKVPPAGPFPNNPAIGTGETGTTVGGATVLSPDCGSYGATDPYRAGGFPNIPRIKTLSIPATIGVNATNMTISVSSESNN
jgi:hypothetical protein